MIQKQILHILESNSKIAPQEIAMRLHLDVSEVYNSIKLAEEQGVILKYKAVVDWNKIGEEKIWALIEVKATPYGEKGFNEVAQSIYSFPQVRSVYLASGTYDLLVVVIGDNMQEVAIFVSEKLATLKSIQGTVTHFILKKYKEDGEVLSI